MSHIIIGTCQPKLQNSPTSLTLDEKRAWADAIAERSTGHLPLCIDHAGGELPGAPKNASGAFEVPSQLQIGRIVDAVVHPDEHLLAIAELYYDQPEAHRIFKDIAERRPWGLSLCTNLTVDMDAGRVLSKKITHLGVTQTPEYGDENAWIHYPCLTWQGADDKLTELMAAHPGMYVPEVTRARLRERTRERQAAAPVATAVDTFATRAAAPESNPTAHLPRLAGRESLAVPRLPTTRMADTTTTLPTPAPVETPQPAAPAQQQPPAAPDRQALSQSLVGLHKEFDARFGPWAGAFANAPGQPQYEFYTQDMVKQANELGGRYAALLQEAQITAANWHQLPAGTLQRMSDLQTFKEQAQQYVMQYADERQAAASNPDQMREHTERAKQAVQEFVQQGVPLPVAVEIFASAAKDWSAKADKMKSQRALDAMILKAAAEKQAAVEEAKRQEVALKEAAERQAADHKRSRDEWEAEKQKLRSEFEELSRKVMRIDAPAAAPVPPQPVLVDTMASRFTAPASGYTPPDGMRLSLGTRGLLSKLAPAPTSTPGESKFEQQVVLLSKTDQMPQLQGLQEAHARVRSQPWAKAAGHENHLVTVPSDKRY